MFDYEINKLVYDYFNYYVDDNNDYCDCQHIIFALEYVLNSTLEEIKKNVQGSKVNVTPEQIVTYLNYMFLMEHPEVKKRIENKKNRSINKDNVSYKFLIKSGNDIQDDLICKKYSYEPYTLNYYKKYINIVKRKSLLLLSMIENIGKNNLSLMKPLLNDLDIQISDGKILKEDIVRIIEPMEYNYYLLAQKVKRANNLNTYLYEKISKESLFKAGISEDEMYPTLEIQVRNLEYNDLNGNIRLSKNQEENLKKEQEKRLKRIAKMIVDMFD